MKWQIEAALVRGLVSWVEGTRRNATAIATAILLATVGLGAYTALNLGIDSNTRSLISERIPSLKLHREFTRLFPNIENALFLVVDGDTPELARDAATRLAQGIEDDPDHFVDVYLPGGGEFFESNGLLYRTPEELDLFSDQIARIQPFIAEFERDPSIAHVVEIVRLGLGELGGDRLEDDRWAGVLDRLSEATEKVQRGVLRPVSWEALLLEGSSVEVFTRRSVVVHPVLDFSEFLVARRPMERIRTIAEELDLTPEHGVRVRITGNPALNHEEMLGVIWDIGVGGLFCFVLVAGVLYRALRSLKLVAAALATLLAGLVWTASFATAVVGTLNLASISFAILFIGLGVDFAIHLGTEYADHLCHRQHHGEALRGAASHVGNALVLCTLTTATGFYVFAPTTYRGMAELGLIAGSGMFIILFLTLTLFPALISCWLRVDPARLAGSALRFRGSWTRQVAGRPALVRWLALLAGLVALTLVPRASFNFSPLELRDASTESVQAFKDLLSRVDTSPWYINVTAPDLATAVELAERIAELDVVDRVVTLQSYVPEDQAEKLEILADAAYFMERPLDDPADLKPAPEVEAQLHALERLRQALAEPAASEAGTALRDSSRRLRTALAGFLQQAESSPDPAGSLARLDEVLLSSLPAQIDRLRSALQAEEIRREGLPEGLAARMLARDGTARIQVFPSGDLLRLDDFQHFVDQVRGAAPDASGVPLTLVALGGVVGSSFRQALSAAFLLISVSIWLRWRRLKDVVIVMTPLLLGTSLTVATMVILGIRFNYANVLVVPLLLGIGVDSAIHLLQRAKQGTPEERGLLGTASARAVYYSALTTAVSFGSLSFASHPGLASLGISLSFGLFYNVVCVLVVLPALLALGVGSEAQES